jgi:hypothetical protein
VGQTRPARSKGEITANIARASRKHSYDPQLLDELRQELREAKLRDNIIREIEQAPPLGPERHARLAALFAGGGN